MILNFHIASLLIQEAHEALTGTDALNKLGFELDWDEERVWPRFALIMREELLQASFRQWERNPDLDGGDELTLAFLGVFHPKSPGGSVVDAGIHVYVEREEYYAALHAECEAEERRWSTT